MQKDPLFSWASLPTVDEKTQADFSPNDKLVITGTCAIPGKQNGKLFAFSTLTGEKISETDVSAASVVTVLWHSALNQIFLGLNSGKILAEYDPQQSKQGVMRAIVKQERRRAVEGRALNQT
jgi:hypothetical protein